VNKKELLHQAIDQLTNLEKAASEYRWENRAIGQGHYFTDLWDCIQNALTFSRTRPYLRETLLIEQFRPFRKELLLIQNGCLYTTQTPPRVKETSPEDRRLKADVLTVQRLRKFFDGPNFVQADLTRDAFYEIITAAKLEANGHQENQTKKGKE